MAIGLSLAISFVGEAQQTPTRPTQGRPQAGSLQQPRPQSTTQARRPGLLRPSQLRSSAGVGVRTGATGRPAVGGARMTGSQEPLRAIGAKPVEYGPVPSTEQVVRITRKGPMAAVEFLDTLALATGWNITASPALQEVQLQFWLKEMSPEQAVAVLRHNQI